MASTTDSKPQAELKITRDPPEVPLRSRFRKMPLLVMAVILVIGVGFAAALAASVGKLDELAFEGAKDALQVGVVAVAAALLSFVADDYKRAQEERRFREDFLKDTLKRITASYNKSKGARRIVRARGLSPHSEPTHVRLEAYDNCMAELNQAQLEFEAVKRDLLTSSKRFHSDEWGRKFAEAMEKHLGHVIEEYEAIRPRPDDSVTEISLEELEEFAPFVDPADKSGFKKFSAPHGRAHDAINKELLLLHSGKTTKAASEKMRQELDADQKIAAWAAEWELAEEAAKERKKKRKRG